MNIPIIISTYNRKSLTGITLDAVMACKHKDSKVYVVDDYSDEYDLDWIKSFGVDSAVRVAKFGVGLMAMYKMNLGATMDSDFFIMLDNDALVTPEFDTKSRAYYNGVIRDFYADGTPVIFSPYRSATHEGMPQFLGVDLMKDIGGISLAMDKQTARHILDRNVVWNEKWDYEALKDIPSLAPTQSWIEHIGRHEGGVNAAGDDRGLNFIGYKHNG